MSKYTSIIYRSRSFVGNSSGGYNNSRISTARRNSSAGYNHSQTSIVRSRITAFPDSSIGYSHSWISAIHSRKPFMIDLVLFGSRPFMDTPTLVVTTDNINRLTIQELLLFMRNKNLVNSQLTCRASHWTLFPHGPQLISLMA